MLSGHVCFSPESGHVQCISKCPLSANSGHSAIHSIISSARCWSCKGMSRPSAFAAFRLITS